MKIKNLLHLYKFVIAFLILLELLWLFLPFSWAYKGGLEDALEWIGSGSILPYRVSMIASDLFTLLLFVAYIGMLYLKHWARRLFLTLCLVGAFLFPLYGLSVLSGYESMIGYLITLGDGFVLCLSYTSPLRKYFVRFRNI